MAECPSCHVRLAAQQTPTGVVYACPGCGGRAAALAVVRNSGATPSFVRDLWQKTLDPSSPRVRRCPHCGQRMVQVKCSTAGAPLALDVCKPCASIWFDASEFQEIPRKPDQVYTVLTDDQRERLAMARLKSLNERGADAGEEGPDQGWQWLPAILGLPVECDAPKLTRLPWLTWGIAVACVLTVVAQFQYGKPGGVLAGVGLVDDWGFVPAQWYRHDGLTLITSFFLHGGILHLLSNMYFLMIFGDNVEDNLGRLRYAGLLAAAHLAGAVFHGALDPRSEMPLVGASAGISGVIAYYAIAFPNVRLAFLWRFGFAYLRWFRIPAWGALALFVLLQMIGAWQQVKGFTSVSPLGHLGGLAVGIGVAVVVHVARARTRVVALGDRL